MNVEIGAEAALFPKKDYIYGIFIAVRLLQDIETKYAMLFLLTKEVTNQKLLKTKIKIEKLPLSFTFFVENF
jgi:hypothetical protein